MGDGYTAGQPTALQETILQGVVKVYAAPHCQYGNRFNDEADRDAADHRGARRFFNSCPAREDGGDWERFVRGKDHRFLHLRKVLA